MPRYRFSWSNLPATLLQDLGAGLELLPPIDVALRNKYGARPKPDFVRDAWPTLLDAWLATDSASRAAVVGALRARGLGSVGAPVESADDQMEYLRSCRNTTSLREVVAGTFTVFGESKPIPVPPSLTAPPQNSEVGVPDRTGRAEPENTEESNENQMSLNDWVGQAVATIMGAEEVTRDSDGDIPIRYGSTVCYVRAVDDPPSILVLAPMVVEIARTPALLEALNDINMNISVGRVFHTPSDVVMFVLELYGQQLTVEILRASLDAATYIADHFDHDLQSRFGGKTQYPETSDDSVIV
jgi:hypothetical protein